MVLEIVVIMIWIKYLIKMVTFILMILKPMNIMLIIMVMATINIIMNKLIFIV